VTSALLESTDVDGRTWFGSAHSRGTAVIRIEDRTTVRKDTRSIFFWSNGAAATIVTIGTGRDDRVAITIAGPARAVDSPPIRRACVPGFDRTTGVRPFPHPRHYVPQKRRWTNNPGRKRLGCWNVRYPARPRPLGKRIDSPVRSISATAVCGARRSKTTGTADCGAG